MRRSQSKATISTKFCDRGAARNTHDILPGIPPRYSSAGHSGQSSPKTQTCMTAPMQIGPQARLAEDSGSREARRHDRQERLTADRPASREQEFLAFSTIAPV